MSATEFVIISSAAWTLVSDGLENVLISHTSVWPMHVYRGTAAPTEGDGYHRLDASSPYSMSGIAGQKIYARCGEPGESMVVTVDAV